ncbi:HlyD family efflux transporter periplasmic adaptor subunit [Thalassospira marina]|uniref:Peptidase M50 n=1 Tax=Thalassospira marina TaxID=2048283 RepID=A0ABM6QBW1_9PROT|nr:HlyD family efflux transporter periplasmic adaptor subunit [Thalassospira marina]AUG54021.1 peptidase M50 [Thalassospira marina]
MISLADGFGQSDDFPLPPLRQDLKLLPAENDEYGAPCWTIHDPVRNRYFRIGYAAFEMLHRWSVGKASLLLERITRETVLTPGYGDIRNLITFLHGSGLLLRAGQEAVAEFTRIANAGKPPFWKWLVHNYLFIRVPLFRPDGFLARTQWIADFFASNFVKWLVITIGLIGIIMTIRQWDAFLATFMGFANFQGLVWMAITLTAVKILHELGHAYTARRYGCRVPTMGVAFLVMYPVLYTDTSDAWRLTKRSEKLRVAAAGIRVELMLALIATFLWHVVPPGPAQSAVFLMASATWITTLLINLSPLMRFDGYYLLSDYLRIPNLQTRAFAMTKWSLRRWLFAMDVPAPEPASRHRRRVLVTYSIAVWIYRFFLFLGIALVVYHLFFKVLGILLFAVEILWFIALPILNEIKMWWKMRDHARWTIANVTLLLVLIGAVIAVLVPWRTTISASAQLQAAAEAEIISPANGRIDDVRVDEGSIVKAGDTLIKMQSPELISKRRDLELQLREAEIVLTQAKNNHQLQEDIASQMQEVLRLQASLAAVNARQAQLDIRASMDGIVRDVTDAVYEGNWVSGRQNLMRIVDQNGTHRLIGYVSQQDVMELSETAKARFYPDQITRPVLEVQIDRVDRFNSPVLETPALSSTNGGPLAARPDSNGTFVPVDALYRVSGFVVSPMDTAKGGAAGNVQTEKVDARSRTLETTMRGTLEIDAPARSLAVRMYQAVAAALIREMSF